MIYAAIIAAVASAIGAAISAGQEAKAQAIRQSIADKYKDLPLPVLDKVVAQKLPPEDADRYMKATQSTTAQSDVLGKYMQEVNAKGETPEDRAAYLRMQTQAGGIANSAMGGVQRNMANRGLAGSGLAAALEDQGAQSAINAANASGIKEAADSRGRYMDALGKSGQLAGQMRGQELSAMSSADAINMFNARQQSDADIRNQQLPQQNFDNRMTKLAGESNASNGVAAGYQRGADNTRQEAMGVSNAATRIGAGYDQYGNKVPLSADSNDYQKRGSPSDLANYYGNGWGDDK